MSTPAPRCRRFTGYRPCAPGRACATCLEPDRFDADVLLIDLGALGDVLRTTALLPALHRALPRARVSWLTGPRAAPLLERHPLLDRVVPLDLAALCELPARRFDLLLCADKDRAACGLAMQIPAAEKRGFGLDARGFIVPLNPGAEHLYRVGLDDDLKFRGNTESAPALMARALELPYRGEPYALVLAPGERVGPPRKVGFNTGASAGWPRKHLAREVQAQAIRLVAAEVGEPVLLLGGPEDAERNAWLAAELGPLVEPTPTQGGLRAGAAQVARCEVVVSGDSLGLHLALALGCHAVAWFGPTSPQEIQLFGRGVRLLAEVDCAPCWDAGCSREPACNRAIRPEALRDAVLACLRAREAGTPIDEVRGRWPWTACAR
ncbi:MAG: glycosyltransferase family 9 protein [Pseudomonadota bacterium]